MHGFRGAVQAVDIKWPLTPEYPTDYDAIPVQIQKTAENRDI